MQALDRTAPMLPMMPTTPQRQTHDYVRYGTTSLFATLDMATGKVIGQTQRQHRHQEFLRFLKTIDKATPPDLDLHLILDNYATHKTPQIQQWLLKHPRFHLHFTPTYSSGSSRTPFRPARQARTIWQCWHVPGFVGAACHPSWRHPRRAAPSSTRLLR